MGGPFSHDTIVYTWDRQHKGIPRRKRGASPWKYTRRWDAEVEQNDRRGQNAAKTTCTTYVRNLGSLPHKTEEITLLKRLQWIYRV